ncbi:zn2 cys6 dna-binding protein [Diplodia corticola]|uniref:Zn2 cys6 dna-binding protein n=1 Tax=Diplodia corticola TaxID=236234 RepID=A0A1J9S4X4_9PEZI|nr:zn2 cys6 dna-binding protein [Diplodia corticola]OJD35575.1 zn2 cys6 dna-binding protein [Diplodia corticola]
MAAAHKALRRDSPVSPTFDSSSQHGMSYNPSQPVSGTAVAQPLAHHLDGHDLHPGLPAYPADSAKTLHDKRRHSRGKIHPQIKRSSSTPHMRALALGESSPISPNSDKRRNKLGYHRTSVACGHCRRRKIRCLLAPDDPQGRCSNCIRLKKECNFYPVEQQNPGESRSQAAKRGSVSQVASSSSSSSPRASNASGHEAIEEYNSFQPMGSGEPPPGFAVTSEMDGPLDIKAGGTVPQQTPFPYSPNFDVTTWGQGYPSQTPSDGHSEASSVAYWSATGAPVSASFFTEPVGIQGQSGQESSHGQLAQPQFPPPNQQMWPGGVARSMSYGGPESMPHDFQQFPHSGHLAVQQQRHTTHELGSSGPPNAAVPTSMAAWQPLMPPGSEGMQPGPVQPYNAPWFGEPAQLGSLEEEHNYAYHHPF